MEYYGDRLCISMRDLVAGGIMSEPNYKQLAARGRFDVVRRGGGAAGCYALVAVDSLPQRYQDKVKEVYPGGAQARLEGWIKSNYEVDQQATAFFFSKEKCGVALPREKAQEYITNASVLNTCIKLYERAATAQKLFGGKYDWSMMATTIEILRKHFGHTLPASTLRFRKKVNDYKANGYACLISGKFGNQCARKVDHKTERLILGIAVLPNKPWNTNVLELYNSFVTGELDVYDPETGEMFNPDDFTDKNGEPMVLSEATITNYLNKPKNKILIDKATMSYTTFMHETMPHMHRHHGEFSLSKVSFDDRDLPRKLKDTRIRPKAYYAYDVTSGCCIGYAYNRAKNVDLVVDMFRNMFRLLDRQGWGCPAEVEVENHLMSQWRDSDSFGNKTVTQVNNICCLGYVNIYGHKYEMMDGVDLPNDTGNVGKWRIFMPDGATRYVKGSTNSGYWITGVAHGLYMDMTPVGNFNGSSSTYFTDMYYYSGATGRVVYRGNHYASAVGGVSCAHAGSDASSSSASVGSRLAFRGLLVKAQSVAAYRALSEVA